MNNITQTGLQTVHVVVVHIIPVFPGPEQLVQIQGHLEQQRQNEEERQDQAGSGVLLLRPFNLLDDRVPTVVGGNTSLGHHRHNALQHLTK